MSIERYANNAATTLSGSITNVATTLTVASASPFPSSGNFRILIDSEILLVTSVSGTTFTVVRGMESTAGAAHTSAAAITHVLTAEALENLRADGVMSGASASLPTEEKAGRIYLPNDGQVMMQDNGSSWLNWGPLFPMTPPQTSNLSTWFNQGGATATQTKSGIVLAKAGEGSTDSFRGIIQATSVPYTHTIGFVFNPLKGFNSYSSFGMCLVNSGATQIIIFGLTHRNGSTPGLFAIVQAWTLPGTNNTGPLSVPIWEMFGVIWLRVRNDSTNRFYDLSTDGQNWSNIYSEASGTTLTETQVGLFLSANGPSSETGYLTALHFN